MAKNRFKGWEGAPNFRWRKMISGVTYRVTCAELGLGREQWTAEASLKLQKQHFERLRHRLMLEGQEAHPETKGMKRVIEDLKKQGQDAAELEGHVGEVESRPSGATRNDTALEAEARRRLEEILDVDLRHVHQDVIAHIMIQRPAQARANRTASKAVDPNRRLDHCCKLYIESRRHDEAAGVVTASTVDGNYYSLERLQGYFRPDFLVDHLADFETWGRWGAFCKGKGGGVWSHKTSLNTRTDVRAFVKWLHKSDRLERLPKNFDDYKISKVDEEPETFNDDELRAILLGAPDDLLVYVLLALNTGANQVDISKLVYAKSAEKKHLGWYGKQIRRKRSKTELHARVPKVRYELWPRTLELMHKFKKSDHGVVNRQGRELVFLNEKGLPLVNRDERGSEGKRKNLDSLGRRFQRYLVSIGIRESTTGKGKSFKTLRATAASIIGNNKTWRVFGPLFLGHAPSSMFERAYLKEDCRELQKAIEFIRKRVESLMAGGTRSIGT